MSFKKSCSNVQKNKNIIWASNLTRYQDSVTIRGNNALEQFSLENFRSKILLRVEVIGRYKFHVKETVYAVEDV